MKCAVVLGPGVRIATASVRTGFAMTGSFTWGAVCGGTHGSRPTGHFVGQGPCALPGIQHKTGGRTEASAPTESYKKCDGAGRCGHRPLRKRILRCVGEGLCPSHGRGRTPPLRMRYKGCNGWAEASAPTDTFIANCQWPVARKQGGTDEGASLGVD